MVYGKRAIIDGQVIMHYGWTHGLMRLYDINLPITQRRSANTNLEHRIVQHCSLLLSSPYYLVSTSSHFPTVLDCL